MLFGSLAQGEPAPLTTLIQREKAGFQGKLRGLKGPQDIQQTEKNIFVR